MSGKHSIPDPTEVPYHTDEVPLWNVKICDVHTDKGIVSESIPCFLRGDKYYKCRKSYGKWVETNEQINNILT